MGVLQDALLSHPATTRPLPVLPSWLVTHPLIFQSAPRFFSLVPLIGFSGHPLRWANPSESQGGGGGVKTGESRCSKLLILQKKGRLASKSATLPSCPRCTAPSLLLLFVVSLVFNPPPTKKPSTAVSHYLYCFPSNKRIDQCHSQSLSCLTSITIMQGLFFGGGGWGGCLEDN